MIMGALFMLILISEGVHHHYLLLYYYYYYFRNNHLIGPSPILLEHVALPNIEAYICFSPKKRSMLLYIPPPAPQSWGSPEFWEHPHSRAFGGREWGARHL
jgi:hypothetical protein